MKIAVFGDSKVSEEQWDLTLKYNPNLTEKDKQHTWINRLRQDGHTVDVISRMSCDNSWINLKWQPMYRGEHNYDRFIIRPGAVSAAPYSKVADDVYNHWHENVWQNLGVQFSESSDHESVQYFKLWNKFVSQETKVDIWKTYLFNWTYDKHSVLALPSETDRQIVRNNYLFLESHWQTEILKPKKYLIEWIMKTGSMAKERQDYLKGFKERNPDTEFNLTREHSAKLFHKHFNHAPEQSHDAIYTYVKNWLLYHEQPGIIECDSFGQYEWPCPILEQIEEEMRAAR